MKSRFLVAVLPVLFVTVAVLPASDPVDMDFDVTLSGVELRSGVTVDMHAKIFVNEKHPCQSETILAIHGWDQTGNVWENLAGALFENNPAGRKTCRLVALDLPGHGGSSPPDGMDFGDLTLDDYVVSILRSLDRLHDLNIHPQTMMGHSMGGLLVQMAEQRLLKEGASLRQEFNVKNVILMASVGPAEVPWHPEGASFPPICDPSPWGCYIYFPPQYWYGFFFNIVTGLLVPGTPTPAEIIGHGYHSIEALAATRHLFGSDGEVRPSVDSGIFGPGSRTTLHVVAFEGDSTVFVLENQLLYEYLTGDYSHSNYSLVEGPQTSHMLFLTDPEYMLTVIAGVVSVP